MALLKITLLLCALSIGARGTSDNCETPDNQQGTCKPLKECSFLYSLLDNLTPSKTSHLRKSHCGFVNKHPKVCCPSSAPVFNNSETSTKNGLLPGRDICGMFREDKIIRGEIAQLDGYRWTVLLKYQKDAKEEFYCGGTLISDRYVLTAAHCINGRKLPLKAKLTSVRLNEHNLETNPDCELLGSHATCIDPFIEVPIEEAIVHEEYDPDDSNQYHDIALLRLNKTIRFSDFVVPVCLPTSTDLNKNYTRRWLMRVGWGLYNNTISSKVKVQSQVVVQSSNECGKIVNLKLNERQFCGTKRGTFIKSCSGDSGGSVVIREHGNDGYAAVGVALTGSCDGNQATVYTKVDGYVPWIVSKLRP